MNRKVLMAFIRIDTVFFVIMLPDDLPGTPGKTGCTFSGFRLFDLRIIDNGPGRLNVQIIDKMISFSGSRSFFLIR